MRILVTGGAGFIGSHLIKKLLEDSNNVVFNLDKLSYASNHEFIDGILKKNSHKFSKKYELLKINLENKSDTENALKYACPDLIMHLAAESHVDRSIENPEIFINSNIIGTFNLLEATRKFWNQLSQSKKSIFRFQHISTDEVFGSLGNIGTFSEETPYDPRSPYSASKASSDHLVRSWHYTFGIPIILSNCSNNFGPWQFPEKLIPLSIYKALSNKPIQIYGDGENIRDWLFVDDHIDALVQIARKGRVGESYCVGGNGEKSNKEVVLEICEIMDNKFPLKAPHKNLIKYVSDRPGHDKRYSINPKKINSELSWFAKNNFRDGLQKTVDWYIDNLDWFKKIIDKKNYNYERLGKI